MGSYSNIMVPSNLEKHPLLSPCYSRAPDASNNKPFNLAAMPSLQLIHSAVSSSPSSASASSSSSPLAGSEMKVPKVENGLYFSPDTDSDLPCLKKAKFCHETQKFQTQSIQGREVMESFPLFSVQGPFAKHRDLSDDPCYEDDYSMLTEVPSNSHLNLLTGPSPLGLTLRKSPSLVDLIQRKLAQHDEESSEGCDKAVKSNRLRNTAFSDKDKLKAANFPAMKLRVGTWECTSRYDGDLVAKCYYAKRKLVWEVLESSLKSKMEVQWSDISGIRASFPEDEPAILDIELSRPPLFFREINPQPRKHTLWQSTSDFTEGQATISRHHSIQFPAGILNRHFEKLLQCDLRLKALFDQNRIIVDSCFFDNRNMQIDERHALHYQGVLSDHHSLEALTMTGLSEDHLKHPALCGVDSMKGNLTVQGLQHDPQLARHHMGENIRNGFTIEGLNPDSRQQTLNHQNELGGVPVIHQGSFQLQFSSASPSSVIDTRGSTECSSSSETEEVSRKEYSRSDPVALSNIRSSNCSRQIPPIKANIHMQMNKWGTSTSHSRESSMTWELESAAPPSIQVSEKQALNALSLHLLGEPITSHNAFSLGRANGEDARESFGNVCSRSYVQPMSLNNSRHHGCFGIGESRGYSHVRDSNWSSLLETCNMETAPSSLTSHGSYVDLVYLPRIASQPQFF